MDSYDVIVVGGGASGMTAAIMAARGGAAVCLVEQTEKNGKKLLATGNGRCNYTNKTMSAGFYHSRHPEKVKHVLDAFGYMQTVGFFKELGIFPKAKEGYIYPRSMQAASVRDALCAELIRLNVNIKTAEKAEAVVQKKGVFYVDIAVFPLKETSHAKKGKRQKPDMNGAPARICIQAKRLILACGGKASPSLGSDGSGYILAEKLTHTIVPVLPALNGLCCSGEFFKRVAGVRVEGRIKLLVNGEETASDTGEIQLTEYGISGIPVFQISGPAAWGLKDKKNVSCVMDFFPEWTEEELITYFINRYHQMNGKTIQVFLTGLLPEKLMSLCSELAGIEAFKKLEDVTLNQIKKLAGIVKNFTVTVEKSRGFENAQVCSGGVSLDEMDMRYCLSEKIPGLYIVGELLDADGLCGGYNLQWAWATGYLAGCHAGRMSYVTC